MRLPHRRYSLTSALALLSLYNTDADGGGGGTAVVDDPAKAAADKAAADKAAADKAAADQAEAKKIENLTAIKGVLKLPDKSTLDPALTERTAAIASELGLTPDAAQKVFGHLAQEATAHAEKAVTAAIDALKPGQPGWEKQQTEFKAAALADPVLGNNNPAQLAENLTLAKRVLATFGGTAAQVTELETSGLANSPAALRLLVAVGKAMKEDQFVQAPSKTTANTEDKRLNKMFPSMAPKDA